MNRHNFLAKCKRELAPVKVGEDSGFVRTLTLAEVAEMRKRGQGDDAKTLAALVIACVCDENGQPVFVPDDLGALCEAPAAFLSPLVDAATRINGMTAESVDDAKNG